MLDFRRLALILAVLCLASSPVVHAQSRPNILVIIADDFGIDALGLYGVGTVLPETPHIDALAERGLLFENTWSYPMCTPTRAAMISGSYGGKTGVTRAPGTLELEYTTIFEYLTEPEHGEYANALFGKWHIGPSSDFDHPNDQGVDLYAGYNSGGVDSYYRWKRTINGIVDTSERYVTSELTDRAIDWLDGQSGPWLLWMAHAAPHTPLEVPPDSLYSRTDTAGTLNKYMAMIEALDHEIGRLLSSIDAATLENTVVIFLGDNGTPGNLLQAYPSGHGKATLYEGGIRVPMIIAGAGVPRRGSVEPGLVNIVDIYATIASLAGNALEGGLDNSRSFAPLLADSTVGGRLFNFIEYGPENDVACAIRDSRYKLILSADGSQELYDLQSDPLEEREMDIDQLTMPVRERLRILADEAVVRRAGWSCQDDIRNGDEEGIDCGGTSCSNCLSDAGSLTESSLMRVRYDRSAERIALEGQNVGDNGIEILLYQTAGDLVYRRLLKAGENRASVAGLPHVPYFVEVRRNGVLVATGRFVR